VCIKKNEGMMLYPNLLWNPINLIEGEGRWMVLELTIVLGALAATKALDLLVRQLSKRLQNAYFDIVSDSLYYPLISLLWFSAALQSFDLVTDGFLSESHRGGWALTFNFATLGIFGWFLFRLKNGLTAYAIESRTQKEASPDTFSILAISKLFTILIVITILILFNDITGMSLTTLLAFGGVGGLAIAFASQEIVSNFFGGLMLHITRPFIVGEIILFPSNNVEGVIEEIGWYQTRIRSLSKAAVYVPNSLFTKALLINKSRATHRPLELTLYVEVGEIKSLEPILESLTKYVQEHAQVDRHKWSGARLSSIGPAATIQISAITKANSDEAFYKLCDTMTLKLAQIVVEHKGRLVLAPQAFVLK
jgi:MscS family membrane protein